MKQRSLPLVILLVCCLLGGLGWWHLSSDQAGASGPGDAISVEAGGSTREDRESSETNSPINQRKAASTDESTVSLKLTIRGDGLQGAVPRLSYLHAASEKQIANRSPFLDRDSKEAEVSWGRQAELTVLRGDYVALEIRAQAAGGPLLARAMRMLGPLREDSDLTIELGSSNRRLRVLVENPDDCAPEEKIVVLQRPIGASQPFAEVSAKAVGGKGLVVFEDVPAGELLVLGPGAEKDDRPPHVAYTILGQPGGQELERTVKLRAPGPRCTVRFNVSFVRHPDAGRPGRIYVERIRGGSAIRVPLRIDFKRGRSDYALRLPRGRYEFGVVPLGALSLHGPLAEEGFACDGETGVELPGTLRVFSHSSTCVLQLKGINRSKLPARVLFLPRGDVIRSATLEDNFIGRYAWTSLKMHVPSSLGAGRIFVLGRSEAWISSSDVVLGGSIATAELVPATILNIECGGGSPGEIAGAALSYEVRHPMGKDIVVLRPAVPGSLAGPFQCRAILPRGELKFRILDDFDLGEAASRVGGLPEAFVVDATRPMQRKRL